MGAGGKGTKESNKKEVQSVNKLPPVESRGFARPMVLLSDYFNELLMPIVISHHSVQMVANFQRFCGLDAQGKAHNLFLDFYFRLASTAGEEIFLLMPLVFWLALPVAVPFLGNFFFMQIAGQLAKDFFRLPRPVSPKDCKNPIIKLDTHFETEYGLPSTHTIAGLLPLVTLLILSRHGMPISVTAWVMSGVYWVSVALSRLYLGVHSVYDLIAGAILGVTMMLFLHCYGDSLDVLLYQYSGAIYVQLLLLMVYFVFYPRAGPWSASMGTAAQMMGPFFGCGLSLWYILNINHSLRDTLLQYSMVNPRPYLTTIVDSIYPTSDVTSGATSVYDLSMSLTHTNITENVSIDWYNTDPESFNTIDNRQIAYRIIVACVICGLGKVLFKIMPSIVFTTLYKYKLICDSEIHRKDCFDRVVPAAKAYCVEVPVRVLNYALLGMLTILACPYVWQRLPPLSH
eukprot:gene9031-10665_t